MHMQILKTSKSLYLRDLYSSYEKAKDKIRIELITDDPKTWHKSGQQSRSHCEPGDGKPKSLGRSSATSAIIYVHPDRVNPKHKSYESGVLTHELVHALDLAYGRYHSDGKVRERRAVFFQNVWRDHIGYKLRENYHGRFSTTDYQKAKSTNKIKDYVQWILSQNGLPQF